MPTWVDAILRYQAVPLSLRIWLVIVCYTVLCVLIPCLVVWVASALTKAK